MESELTSAVSTAKYVPLIVTETTVFAGMALGVTVNATQNVKKL